MTPTTEALDPAYRPTEEEKVWALIAHLSPSVALFLGPLLVFLLKGNESKWVRAHAIESLNFSITLCIGYAICFALAFVFIGFCLMVPLYAFAIITHILAAVKAWQGGVYRYPLSVRLISE
jgi:uncharacterized Tic20 family protein